MSESQLNYNPGESGVFTGTLLDVAGTAIPLANINSLTLTLTDASTGTIINSRNAQNVLNANNVTVNSTTGAMQWLIQPADTTMNNSLLSIEDHVATFTWTYETSKVGIHRHRLRLINYLTLCTVDDIRMILGSISDNDIPFVQVLIENFSSLAEAWCDRQFKTTTVGSPSVETFTGYKDRAKYRVKRYPIDSIISIVETSDGQFAQGTTLDSTDYSYMASEGIVSLRWRNFMEGRDNIKITYTGGLARDPGGVPSDLRYAATRQVAYWYQRRTQVGTTETSIARSGRQRLLRAPDIFLPEIETILSTYVPTFI